MGCTVRAIESGPELFRLPEITNDPTRNQRFSNHRQATKYLKVAVETKGRTVNEALNKALDSLNMLRGLWMLREKLGRCEIRFGLHPHRPIGVVFLGPIHTVHHPDGSLAIDDYWYEQGYPGDEPLFEPKSGWDALTEFTDSALIQIENHTYKRDLQHLLILFANALSQTDPDVAFLQLWCILERITDTVGARYDETIERALWSFVKPAVFKEQLAHLRFRRNQYVHAAKTDGEMEQTAQIAKSHVEKHLVRLIENGYGVGSIKEYGEILSLPANLETLKKRREHLDLAIQMREKVAESE